MGYTPPRPQHRCPPGSIRVPRPSGLMARVEWEGAESTASCFSAHLLLCRQGHVTVSPGKGDDDDNINSNFTREEGCEYLTSSPVLGAHFYHHPTAQMKNCQRGEGTSMGSQGQSVAEPGMKPSQSGYWRYWRLPHKTILPFKKRNALLSLVLCVPFTPYLPYLFLSSA